MPNVQARADVHRLADEQAVLSSPAQPLDLAKQDAGRKLVAPSTSSGSRLIIATLTSSAAPNIARIVPLLRRMSWNASARRRTVASP
jgi:hypothetical protein